jgi:7,8-dihydropterin-6-yl-methyl-4-(beta-D-ribofuranosyl)aminobenzene 5'-phosphate synthase
MTVRMTIIAENRVGLSKALIGEHGFCAYVETQGKRILWDTGQGSCIVKNPSFLGVDLKKIDLIALSHGHFDHTGGLEHALKTRGGCEVVCHPACFENKKAERELFGKTVEVPVGLPWSRERLESLGARFRLVEDSAEIYEGVHFFTGIPMATEFERIEKGFFVDDEDGRREDGLPDDAALAVVTDKGLSVILGCAHRGMINTIKHIKSRLGIHKVHSVWGGTHMIDRTAEEVEATIDALSGLGVERIGTAHCTGFANELKVADAFPDQFVFAHVGVRAEL